MKKAGKDKQAAKKTGKDKQATKKAGKDKKAAKKTGKDKQAAKKTGKDKQAAKKTGKNKHAAKKTGNEKKPRKAPVSTTTMPNRRNLITSHGVLIDIRRAATNEPGRPHEPPRPQHFASGLRPSLWRTGMDVDRQGKVDSVLSQLVVEDFTSSTQRAKDGDETE